MSKIINKLKKNYFNEVEKSHLNCPICNSDLYTVHNWMYVVMDGNTVYQCENGEEHKFWIHPFERNRNVLHLNKHASETNWDSEQDYELIDGIWKTIEK